MGNQGIYRFKRLDDGEKGKQTGFQQGDSVFKRVSHNRIYNGHNFRILTCTDAKNLLYPEKKRI